MRDDEHWLGVSLKRLLPGRDTFTIICIVYSFILSKWSNYLSISFSILVTTTSIINQFDNMIVFPSHTVYLLRVRLFVRSSTSQTSYFHSSNFTFIFILSYPVFSRGVDPSDSHSSMHRQSLFFVNYTDRS